MNSSKPSKTPVTSYMTSDVPVIADSLVWEADDKVKFLFDKLLSFNGSAS